MKRRALTVVGRVLGRFRRTVGFRAEIEVTRAADVVEIGSTVYYDVRVRNVGWRRWRARGPNPVCLSYHWLTGDGLDFVREGLASPLPADLRPGEEALVRCRVKAPHAAGRFLLEFDLLRKHVGWFRSSGSMAARTVCQVRGKVCEGWDDYLSKWSQADLDRDHWTIVGPASKAEFDSLGRVKLDCMIEVGLTPDSHVLDVGCGTGQLAQALAGYLSPRGLYYGTDIAAKAIDFCRERYRHPKFFFLQSEMTRVPIDDRQFDAIVLFSVLTHIYPREMRALLEDLKRLLKATGWILADAFVSSSVRPASADRAMVRSNEAHLQRTLAATGLHVELLDRMDWSDDCQRVTYKFTHDQGCTAAAE